MSQPKRRTFTAAYKLEMIGKYDAATEPGAKGALLRGEGLYDSHISYWRKARDSGSLKSSAAAVPVNGVPAAHKGRAAGDSENERLRKRLAKAEVKLEQTRAALDIMGKAFALWSCSPRARIRRSRKPDNRGYLRFPGTGDEREKACELTGKSRATLYRRRTGTRQGCRERRPAPPNALPAGERQEVLAVLDSPHKFASLQRRPPEPCTCPLPQEARPGSDPRLRQRPYWPAGPSW